MRIIKKKKDIILLKKFIILGVLSCIAVSLCVAIWHKDDSNKNTEAGDKAVIIDDSISKNDIPSMYDEKILRDELLNSSSFSSYNEERLLIIKVKADDHYVYESDFLRLFFVCPGIAVMISMLIFSKAASFAALTASIASFAE